MHKNEISVKIPHINVLVTNANFLQHNCHFPYFLDMGKQENTMNAERKLKFVTLCNFIKIFRK